MRSWTLSSAAPRIWHRRSTARICKESPRCWRNALAGFPMPMSSRRWRSHYAACRLPREIVTCLSCRRSTSTGIPRRTSRLVPPSLRSRCTRPRFVLFVRRHDGDGPHRWAKGALSIGVDDPTILTRARYGKAAGQATVRHGHEYNPLPVAVPTRRTESLY